MKGILDRRLIVVTGKGGVGKTTVAAALGLCAVEAGRRALLVEFGAQSRMCTMFSKRPPEIGEEQRLADGLSSVSIDPDKALIEWTQHLGGRVSARVLASSGTFQYFAAAAPGARELVSMVKILNLTGPGRGRGRRGNDLVILDAPATGHALGMLRSPETFGRIARVGPIVRDTEEVRRLLTDPARSAYVAVAQGTEMAVTETIELQDGLHEALGRDLAGVVVNGLLPRRFSAPELASIQALARSEGAGRANGSAPGLTVAAARAADEVHRRASFQHGQVTRLRRRGFEVLGMPFLWEGELGLAPFASSPLGSPGGSSRTRRCRTPRRRARRDHRARDRSIPATRRTQCARPADPERPASDPVALRSPSRSRGGPAGCRRRASRGAPELTGRDGHERPARVCSSLRAAVPIALIIVPRAPIRMPFWDSLSTQIRARTRTSPSWCSISSTITSTAWGTSWNVRRMAASRISSATCSSGDWSEEVPMSNMKGPSGSSEPRCSISSPTPAPVRAEIGNTSPSRPRAAAPERTSSSAGRGEAVDLVDRDRRPAAGARESAGDEPVPGADALLGVEDQQRGVRTLELLLDAPGHAGRQRVPRALHPGQVDEHDLGLAALVNPADRTAGRLGAVGDDRDLLTHDDVDEGRLAHVRPARERHEAAAGHGEGGWVRFNSSACSASISPESVS